MIHNILRSITGGVLQNNLSTHSRVKRNRRDRRTFLKTDGTDELKICCFSHSIIAQSILPFSPLFSPFLPFSPLFSPLSPLSPRKTDRTEEQIPFFPSFRFSSLLSLGKRGIKEGRRRACAPPAYLKLPFSLPTGEGRGGASLHHELFPTLYIHALCEFARTLKLGTVCDASAREVVDGIGIYLSDLL